MKTLGLLLCKQALDAPIQPKQKQPHAYAPPPIFPTQRMKLTLYSDSRVVGKAKGAPTAMDQPIAMSPALPV